MNLSNPYANVLYVDLCSGSKQFRGLVQKLWRRNSAYHRGCQRELPKVSFTGTLGDVHFDLDQEVKITVDILQIKNGMSFPIGNYDPVQQNLTYFDKESIDQIPSDELERVYRRFSTSLTVTLSSALVVCSLFTMLTHVHYSLFNVLSEQINKGKV